MAKWEEYLFLLRKSRVQSIAQHKPDSEGHADTLNTWREANGLGAPIHPET